MRKNRIMILLIISVMIGSTVTLVNLNYASAIDVFDEITLNYDDVFTDRFTGLPIEGASVVLYVYTQDLENNEIIYLLGTATTNENGWFNINGTVDILYINGYIPFYTTYLDFQKEDYISEFYQYDDNGWIVKLNHEGEGWTPEYQCDYYGYVKRDLFPYPPISGATIEIWGVDDHFVNFLCESTTTNSQGYFNLECNFENPYPNPQHRVAEYYYIKVIKFGFVTETIPITAGLYPYPNGNINLGTIYMWGLSRW